MIEELKKKFVERDRVLHIISKSGAFRAVAVKNTTTAQTAQKAHNLENISAYFLAKTLTSATMISTFLKGEERVIIEISSNNGFINKIYAEAMQVGECRGFVRLTSSNNSNQITTLANVLGDAQFKVSRILYSQVEPIVGIVPSQNSDISADLAYYFLQSEQINSAVILDVDFDNNDKIVSSGGILVQAMPGASQEEINAVVNSIGKINKLCAELERFSSLEEVLQHNLPFEFDIIKTKQVDFFCRCNIETFKARLLLLKLEEIEDMQKKRQNELVCHYCNKHYYLSETDFEEIIERIKIQQN